MPAVTKRVKCSGCDERHVCAAATVRDDTGETTAVWYCPVCLWTAAGFAVDGYNAITAVAVTVEG